MILKLLVLLAVASIARTYTIPASLCGARTGRALTKETPKATRLLRTTRLPRTLLGLRAQ